MGVDGRSAYLRFPMPFAKSARIELVSERKSTVVVEAEVDSNSTPKASDEAHLYAAWHREPRTRDGSPFVFLDTQGEGHVVGVIQQAQGFEPGSTGFFEGDDQATIDGVLTIHGTGSEDFFNGGWYDLPGRWYSRLSFPLSGCLDYKKHMARTGAYRLFLNDAMSYRKSILLTIEHGPTKNAIPTDYTGVTYFYSRQRPTADISLPPLAERRVTAPDRLVYDMGWNIAIAAMSGNSTLQKERIPIGKDQVRVLTFIPNGRAEFGTSYMAPVADVPEAGRYAVSIEGLSGPGLGSLTAAVNDQPQGATADFQADQHERSGVRELTVMELKEGLNPIYLHITGKVELTRLHLRRVQ
jgi:hypothetical protein